MSETSEKSKPADTSTKDVFNRFVTQYNNQQDTEMTLEEYLELCKTDPLAYAGPAERILNAIGEPELVDTSKDASRGRVFQNRTIKVYPAFKDFFGMEDVVEKIVGYFTHSAQGLEEKKQIFYLLGPVGGGKSSLAERIKELMEVNPIYVLKAGDDLSPVFESPLSLFTKDDADFLSQFNIPANKLSSIPSPWNVKRLDEFGGDISKFKVVKVFPSKLRQRAVVKTEPGDDNNQDISSLVGKVDLRKLDELAQNDPDAYSFSGALCRGNQGVMEFVEMFKAPIKTLHPLLTATQEGNFVGSEEIGPIPFDGIVMAHSNESEWKSFRGSKSNEAFLDRVYLVKVPYCLRYDQEKKIYEKLLETSNLEDAPCAPKTLDLLAKFSVMTRLKEHENSTKFTKMRIYNGENLKDVDPSAKSIQEYRDFAGVDEGMDGTSTRFAFKVLSKTFNHDPEEVAADPIHLFYVLEEAIKQEQLGETEQEYIDYIKGVLTPKFADEIGKEIQRAYLESYKDYGQNIFDNYINYAECWIEDTTFKDHDTGTLLKRADLEKELEKLEKPANISNPEDFRQEVVRFVLRFRAENGKNNPAWNAYQKMKEVIENRMFASMEELLPVISSNKQKTADEQKKHDGFVTRMEEKGYTTRQIKRVVDFYSRYSKSN
jgi:serine protein kinase